MAMSCTLNTLVNQLQQAQQRLTQEQQRVASGKHFDRPSAELTQQRLDDAALDVTRQTFDLSLLDFLR
jgi:hypothetical protein